MLALARRLGRLGSAGPPLHPEGALPLLLDSLLQLRQAHVARDYRGDDDWQQRRRQRPEPFDSPADELLDEPEPQLRLPDLETIHKLNPQLHDVMLQHQALQKSAGTVETILAALQEANPGARAPSRVTKTALRALRLDALRSLLSRLSADTRGQKEVLVERALRLGSVDAKAAAEQAAVERAAAEVKEGLVSRRQVAEQQAMARQLADAAERGGYGAPASSLAEAHRDMVQRAQFANVFTAQEVADIFADARADDIVVIDVRGRCPFTDWMVLATARSEQLARMLAGAVLHALKARAREVAPGVAPGIEGGQQGSEWLVVDAGSVVAHVFLEGCRREYALEELWGLPDGSNLRRVAPKPTLHTLDTLS